MTETTTTIAEIYEKLEEAEQQIHTGQVLPAQVALEQLREKDSRVPALIALGSALVCLLVLGPDAFILPALLITVLILLALRPGLEVQP